MLTKRAADAAKEAEEAERREEEAESAAEREYRAGRRYSGSKVGRSTSRRKSSGGFGKAVTDVVIKELKGTTGKRIVRGILGSLFKGR